jgi:hypothetical protein
MGGLFVAHAGSDPVHQRSSAPRVRPFLTLGHLAGGHNAVRGAICRVDVAVAGEREASEQLGNALVEDGAVIAAGLVAER